MPPLYEQQTSLPGRIRQWARELGFADAGIAELTLDADAEYLKNWLAEGLHGQMAFLGREIEKRVHPSGLMPGTVSVISVRLDYKPEAEVAEAVLADGEAAYISRYALGRDYHKLVRSRLLKLGARLEAEIAPHGFRVLTDSAPALEKALARNARLGWIGKNTLLLNRRAGSWFFLGEIYTDLALPLDAAPQAQNHCGSCTACLDICPTKAFLGPYRLDARKCISYLTIEHRGAFPVELRALMGNRIFGCDDCQLVCPWNRYAQTTVETDFTPRNGLDAARLVDLFGWDEATWLTRTEGMALRRLDHARWLRNIAIALGNAPRSAAVIAALETRRGHADEAVREHVAWALAQQGAA
ncbi:MAG: tRNA epoxyqueuosine(34) reductase QueG [Pseudomonadota bacterium]